MHTRLTETELWHDDPVGAEQLWAEGFRPSTPGELRPGDEIAALRTMFGLPMSKETYYVMVSKVEPADNAFQVRVFHSGDGSPNIEERDEPEIWVRSHW